MEQIHAFEYLQGFTSHFLLCVYILRLFLYLLFISERDRFVLSFWSCDKTPCSVLKCALRINLHWICVRRVNPTPVEYLISPPSQ